MEKEVFVPIILEENIEWVEHIKSILYPFNMVIADRECSVYIYPDKWFEGKRCDIIAFKWWEDYEFYRIKWNWKVKKYSKYFTKNIHPIIKEIWKIKKKVIKLQKIWRRKLWREWLCEHYMDVIRDLDNGLLMDIVWKICWKDIKENIKIEKNWDKIVSEIFWTSLKIQDYLCSFHHFSIRLTNLKHWVAVR